MGFFDDLIDAVVDTPAKVVEKTAETVTRIPEAGIKAVDGLAKGVEKGVTKTAEEAESLLDKLFP
jgi:hypothetical protein